MRVCSIQNNYYQNYQKPVNFSGNYGVVYAQNGKDVVCKLHTSAFRPNFNFEKFVRFIYQKYKDVPHVFFANHACSSGEETFSFAAMLIDMLGAKEAEKFFPIFGLDYNKGNIESAKSGMFKASADEIRRIEGTLSDPHKFFDYKYNKDDNFYVPQYEFDSVSRLSYPKTNVKVTAKPIIADNIKFYKSDVFKDVDSLPDKNIILAIRNLWLWLTDDQRHLLVDKIADKFQESISTLIIGDADMLATNIHDLLLEKGFEESKVQYVYEKRKPKFSLYC